MISRYVCDIRINKIRIIRGRVNIINPSIGVKYSLIVLGGGFLHYVSVLTSLLVNIFFLNFELKLVFVMTKVVSKREISFIKAVLLLCEYGHLKKSKMVFFHLYACRTRQTKAFK